MRQSGWGVVLLAGLLAACGDSAKTGAGDAALLKHIPADSPYVMALVEPLPRAFMDKMEALYDDLAPVYRDLYADAIKELKDADADLAAAVIEEFVSDISFDGFSGRGIDLRTTTAALYGYGMLPVMRLSLADPEKFDATIARIEERAGETFATGTAGGRTYRMVSGAKAEFVFANLDGYLVVTVLPPSASDALRSAVLGVAAPVESLAAAGRLAQLMGERNYTPHFGGFVDLRDITERFISDPRGTDREVFEALDFKPADLSDVCKREIRELVEAAPEVVMGYTRVDGKQLDGELLWRVREDIAKDMATIAAPVPGLGSDSDAMFAFGVGLHIAKAKAFLEKRIAAVEADPFECEQFADFEKGLTELKAGLDQPMMPFITSVKGFWAVMDSIELPEAEGSSSPNASGRILLALDAPQTMLGMAQMFAPQIASLDIKPDGVPVKLDAGAMPGVQAPVYLAMSDDALAFSHGEGQHEKLGTMLEANSPGDPPLMAFAYDMGAYLEFFPQLMKMTPRDEAAADDEELVEAISGLSGSLSKRFGMARFALVFDRNGVRFDQSMALK